MALLVIAPTITTGDSNKYKLIVETYHPFAKRVQVDVSDGSLPLAAVTIPDTAVWWPKGWIIDMHMMVAKPSTHIPALLKLVPSLVIFHPEAEEDLKPIFATLKENNIKVGIAIVKSVYPGAIQDIIETVDHVMLFSGNLGQTGGTADLLQLEKVRIIKKIKPTVEIGWDGGANIRNVRTIAQAGVNVINVGSAIVDSPDPAKMYANLVAEAEKQGVI
jgi:ribulose-phosphate 3-epimerase